MALAQGGAVIVVGMGVAGRCRAEEAISLFEQACATHGVSPQEATMIATIADRVRHPAIVEAANRLGLGVVVPPLDRLREAAGRCLTHSERVENRFGLPSVAEAAALAAGGPEARLIGPRLQSLHATIALVRA
jgi:cobalt-precorrin 5A hydrolase